LGAADGLRVLRAGSAEGVMRGGCISILAEALGTPYAPETAGSVLFLEDVGTKPYKWDRLLLHLRYSGRLKGVRGLVFGDMGQCVDPEENEYLERALLHALRDFEGPIAIGLRCGHVKGANITLPLGIPVRLDLTDAANPRMTFQDAAVSG
jgi:muramoyltetrapeptide carboxypeptidase